MESVPQSFQAFLPSSPVKNLHASRDKNYIIESFLKNASLEAWQWMARQYTSKDIKEVVKNSRSLKPKDVMLWHHLLSIPLEEIRCLQAKSHPTPKSSWNY